MSITRKFASAVAIAGSMAFAATANAQAVNFVGSVTGCFFSGAAPTTSAGCAAGSTVAGSGGNTLTYTGSTFNVTSNPADGNLSIGNAAATPNVNNLGSFTLAGGHTNYTGKQFALFMTFTTPGSQSGSYTSALTGNLTGAANGNVKIDFDNTDRTYTFANGVTLTFNVNDLSVNNQGTSNTTAVTGQGVVTTTPEPSSMALLGTGLVGLVPMFRRRKSA